MVEARVEATEQSEFPQNTCTATAAMRVVAVAV